MRIEKIQPKLSQIVVIPDNLQVFLYEVDILIKQNNELATIESDDLLQTNFVYGGLIKEGSDQYSFSYFSGEHTRQKWEIEISASEIAAIANRKLTELSLWQCNDTNCERLFATADGTCFECDYIDDEFDQKKIILKTLSQSLTQEAWVKDYLLHYPNAHPLQIIGDYNSERQLGRKWGFFSVEKMQTLISKVKQSKDAN